MSYFATSCADLCDCLNGICTNGSSIEQRAIARNLLGEHRVSKERFDNFWQHPAGQPVEAIDLENVLEDYRRKRVRPKRVSGQLPAYEQNDNAWNRVVLPPQTYFVTILDLSSLGDAYSEARQAGLPGFERFNASGTPEDVRNFLEEVLLTPESRPQAMEQILAAREHYRTGPSPNIYATWAAEWNSLSSFLRPANPNRWLESVGVPREDPAWIAATCYAAPDFVFRPTQIDAGWYPEHFPSHPGAETKLGGFTMDLNKTHTGKLVNEYIHRQVEFTVSDWERAGSLVARVDNPTSSKGVLGDRRRKHLEVLFQCFGADVAWMPSYL